MFSGDMYRNPFSDYNANTMNSEQIMDFWESPFEKYLSDITEEEIATEKTAITFTGGRGTGKTMLLKHFSVFSQNVRAERQGVSLKQYIQEVGYVGIYIRFDTPLLQSFDGSGVSQEGWSVIFTHFFELMICKQFLSALILLDEKNVLSEEEKRKVVINLAELLQKEENTSLEELLKHIICEINYVNEYKGEAVFSETRFHPTKLYPFGSLMHSLAKIITENCEVLKTTNFLVLLDEYENFLTHEQRIVNSAIKFSQNIAFRVGMRPTGFHTYATVSQDEFIKEHRDYRNVVFENPMIGKNHSGYFEFLRGIAKKRLSSIPLFYDKGMVELEAFLGKQECPEAEAIRIVKGRNIHITEYLKEIKNAYKKAKKEYELSDAQIDALRSPENPLFEMQNMRMLLRLYAPEFVIKAFHDYTNKIESPEANKYKNDYVNKYKLSYVFVLRSIYKVESKQYYGFKDFAYLSSGIVGTFIELCRCAFQYAYFSDKDSLLKGEISPELQTAAIRDVAISEFEQIPRIAKVGNEVYHFAKNIGTEFSKYHTTKRISYPETNQFSFDSKELREGSQEELVFKAALMWSVIQKKQGLQQASIGMADEELYILNRIYSPIFQISARTRGGFNIIVEKERFTALLMQEPDIDSQDEVEDGQMSFYDYDWGIIDE